MLLFFIVVDDIYPNYWGDGSTSEEFCLWLNEAVKEEGIGVEEEGINKSLDSSAELAAIRLLGNIRVSKRHMNTFFSNTQKQSW